MRLKTAILATVTLAVLAGVVPAGAAAAETPDLHLLEPTGDSAVGVTQLHLVDTERADPWVPAENRELMVSVWYPTRQDTGPTVPYMTPEESRLFLEQEELDLPADILSTVETHARADAKPSGGRHPLVVLSPGWTKPRAILSGLAEDLASRGYIVAVIGHNYETVTEFPGGRTTTCRACGLGELTKAMRGRAEDVRFVIDELTDRNGPWKGARLIDPKRIAMGGHSLGGASSFAAMRLDPRIKAGFDIDGTIHELPEIPLDRPYLLMGHEGTTVNNRTWERAWALSTGWRRWLEVEGTAHASFTDVGLISAQLGMPPIGEIDPERATAVTRAYVTAFLDEHLRGCGSLLDGPSAEYPEVRFHNP